MAPAGCPSRQTPSRGEADHPPHAPEPSRPLKSKQYGAGVPRGQPATADAETGGHEQVSLRHLPSPGPPEGDRGHGSLERLVTQAAARIARLSAVEAYSAAPADGIIIDIRSQDTRELHGVVPGSLHIPRTVLEWRIAIDSPWRNVHLGGLDQRLILICDHGYSSILAASNLVELGFLRAADVIGGFASWQADGLPVTPYRPRLSTVGALPGTSPPQ